MVDPRRAIAERPLLQDDARTREDCAELVRKHARRQHVQRYRLRGKPALLLLFSDTCPPGDPACDVFPQLERVYQREGMSSAYGRSLVLLRPEPMPPTKCPPVFPEVIKRFSEGRDHVGRYNASRTTPHEEEWA